MHLGKIGSTVDAQVKVIKVICRKQWTENPYLCVLRTMTGHTLTITSVNDAFKVGETWDIIGTVKRHSTFCGTKQTHVKWEQMAIQGKNISKY